MSQRSPLKSKENTPGVSSEDCCGDSLANFPGNGSRGTGHGGQKTQRQTKIDKDMYMLSICYQYVGSFMHQVSFDPRSTCKYDAKVKCGTSGSNSFHIGNSSFTSESVRHLGAVKLGSHLAEGVETFRGIQMSGFPDFYTSGSTVFRPRLHFWWCHFN